MTFLKSNQLADTTKPKKSSKLSLLLRLSVLAGLSLSQLAGPLSTVYAETIEEETALVSTLPKLDVNKLSARDNLFHYANYAWLLDNQVDGETTSVTQMDEVGNRNQRLLQEDVEALISGELKADTSELKEFVALQKLFADSEKREADGITPILSYLEEIVALNSMEDFNQTFAKLVTYGYTLPVQLSVAADVKDTSINVLYLSEPELYFGQRENYDNVETLKEEKEAFMTNSKALFQVAGYSEEEAKTFVEQALSFDDAMSVFLRPASELAKSTNTYHPRSLSKLDKKIKQLDLKAIVQEVTGQTPKTVIISNPEYFAYLDQLVNKDNLAQIKSWLMLNLLRDSAPYLNSAMYYAQYASEVGDTDGEQESETVTSVDESAIEEENQNQATYLAMQEFEQVLGQLFAKRHLSKGATETVSGMVHNMINVYKDRVKNNSWLSEVTKEKAVEKLDKLKVYVGAPETLPAIYSQKIVDKEKSAYDNVRYFNELYLADNFKQLGQKSDLSDWGFPAYEVNAFYMPQTNAVYFPAGFLQAPIYDEANSISANYGAIGTVIGHEITHALDSDGALYDADGNLKNWWTEDDFKAFNERTKEMIDLWDGIPYATGQVNGELTVTENIADLGGMAVALEALKKEENHDLRVFFVSYARLWAQIATDDYHLDLMATDTHSPNELRANIVPTHFEDFHTIFKTQEGDKMYRSPKDRLVIW